MAEKIVSPGVFTRERDLSILPAAIGQIGAAVIGPTVKGPAFEPVIIESFKEFEETFGPKTLDSYVPYTVEGYLKSAGRVTVFADDASINITFPESAFVNAVDVPVGDEFALNNPPAPVKVIPPCTTPPSTNEIALSFLLNLYFPTLCAIIFLLNVESLLSRF